MVGSHQEERKQREVHRHQQNPTIRVRVLLVHTDQDAEPLGPEDDEGKHSENRHPENPPGQWRRARPQQRSIPVLLVNTNHSAGILGMPT